MRIGVCTWVIAWVCLGTSAWAACEKPQEIATVVAEEAERKLSDDKASTTSRLAAFDQLFCSTNRTLSHLAQVTALKSSTEALRWHALAAILMARESITIELIEDKTTDAVGRQFIMSRGGSITYTIYSRDYSRNCMDWLRSATPCQHDRYFAIDGPTVRYGDSGVFTGTFTLQPHDARSGVILRGTVKVRTNAPITAIIRVLGP